MFSLNLSNSGELTRLTFPGSSRLHWSDFLPSVGKTVNLLPHRNWTILTRFAICIHTTLANASFFVSSRSVKVPGGDLKGLVHDNAHARRLSLHD